jgi:ABC-type transport system involved in multi-copper enzyme maturation permease subunit
MYKALIFKEWRELWWTGAIALVVLSCVVFDEVGFVLDLEKIAIVRRDTGRIPFRSDDMQLAVTSVSFCLAIVLGLGQTLGESVRGTWRYLRQRPISFSRLLMTKIIAGLGLLVFSTGVPLALYLIWAASDGLHSSPFEWQMAVPTFVGWTSSAAVFLTAFLIGLREARWYGSRLWPAAPVVVLYLYFGQFQTNAIPAGGAILLLTAALLGAIVFSANERDD